MTDFLDPACVHEAGHSVVAWACGREAGPVAVRAESGRSFHIPPKVAADIIAGLVCDDPFILWAPEVRARFEGDVLIAMAGQVAEDHFAPRAGRVPEPVSAQAAELLATLPPPTAGERRTVADSFTVTAMVTDEERVARAAWAAFGSDLASAGTWLHFMEAQCRYLVGGYSGRIKRLAFALAEADDVLSGEAVAALVGVPA
jgi:hypothetical protein